MIIATFAQFWRQHPALFYGLAMLLGAACSLSWTPVWLVPIAMLLLPLSLLCMRLQPLLAITLGTLLFFYTESLYHFPQLPQEGLTGTALFEISSVSSSTTHFGKRWLYKGKITAFSAEEEINLKNLPCTISLPQSDEIRRPPANCSYKIDGRLKESSPGRYALKVGKHTPWHSIQHSYSFAELRFKVRQWISQHIQSKISDSRAATFLIGIATGDFDDPLMNYEFSRFGVQHIMAVSGFHFSILAGILSLLLCFILPKKYAVSVLLFLLSGYFFMLGPLPSVMRAWIAAVIVLVGFLWQKQGSGLNSLGISLMALMMYEPLFILNLGFQLSFLSTAAILLLYSPCDWLLQQLFEKRALSMMIRMDTLNQHGYCLLAFFRQALALNCAVITFTLPILLFLFQKFPMMSLLYNLFFPFLVSISMLLLILGLLLTWVPFIGSLIYWLNDYYTQLVLNTAYNFPPHLDLLWRVAPFPYEYLILYVSFITWISLILRFLINQNKYSLIELI